MADRCPGQDGRNIKSEHIACFACGYTAEIFSDELSVKCPGCKTRIFRKRLPSCVEWCKAAKECIGKGGG
ncbi:MAG: phosphohydrolase [Candidatus Omnitrophota bacterium]